MKLLNRMVKILIVPTDSPAREPRAMSDHAGKLSVLIPVYNEENYVSEIITRVLALGDVVKELVIVDDG